MKFFVMIATSPHSLAVCAQGDWKQGILLFWPYHNINAMYLVPPYPQAIFQASIKQIF